MIKELEAKNDAGRRDAQLYSRLAVRPIRKLGAKSNAGRCDAQLRSKNHEGSLQALSESRSSDQSMIHESSTEGTEERRRCAQDARSPTMKLEEVGPQRESHGGTKFGRAGRRVLVFSSRFRKETNEHEDPPNLRYIQDGGDAHFLEFSNA